VEGFSSGLVTGLEEKPADPDSILDPIARHPLARAYTLVRLGRLSGFKGLIFPEGEREPVWTLTDVNGVLVLPPTLYEGKRPRFGPAI
jgi:hypothetical protein